MNIAILDTSVCTENLGDYIIMDSVRRELYNLFPMHHKMTLPTHEKIDKVGYSIIKSSQYSFIGGTNLLSSNMNKYNQWKVNLKDTLNVNNILLMGVGWWQYQNKPNRYTKYLFRKLLNHTLLHSVRDAYTESKLKEMGFSNVINTACPTMWTLTPEHCKLIPRKKAETVAFTLTDYNIDRELDQLLIDTLLENYKTIYFWVQGAGDYKYLNSLQRVENIKIIHPDLQSYDDILDRGEEIDYIGTRLHAGVRALQKKRRSLIIAIDNRAIEKSKDFNLPIIDRTHIKTHLARMISSEFRTEIKIPLENIITWKKQFQQQ